MSLTVEWFQGNDAEWDRFILQDSRNGLFLETRKFINYHPVNRFLDRSLCIRKGKALVGAILACEIEEDGKRIFFAHKGTTFGGISISSQVYSATHMDELLQAVLAFLKQEGFDKIYLKLVPEIYQRNNSSLVDYFLYKNGFRRYDELNFYMHLNRYRTDVLSQFSSGKRRDYRYSLKNKLQFRLLETEGEIASYYEVLLKNLKKLDLPVVHSLEDLYDLRFHRFPDWIRFYGVYLEDQIIAGSMIFLFNNNSIFHTQYLSSDEEYLKLFPMDFLIENLIETAAKENFDLFSFGICTEDQGRYINLGLSRFKEGFGTEYCINRSYELDLK